MLDHIALLRAIKKKKNFSRPTDPASRRASMDKQTIFFLLALGSTAMMAST